MKLLILLLAGIACYSRTNVCAEQEIKPGQSVNSPDGRFTAELTNDSEGSLHIRSNTTGNLYKIGVFRPLYSLKWTGDSQTVVTIEHLAGGSQAVLIYFDGGKWRRFEVDPTKPPPPYHHYAVIKEDIGWDMVKLKYKVTDEKGNGIVTKFYLCSFNVDTRTRSIAKMQTHEINADAYWKANWDSGSKSHRN
jgi:hypothetical protein